MSDAVLCELIINKLPPSATFLACYRKKTSFSLSGQLWVTNVDFGSNY